MPDTDTDIQLSVVEQIRADGVRRPKDCLKVCELMTEAKSMAKACEIVGIPHSTFLSYVKDSKTLFDRYARAREILTDVLADDFLRPVKYKDFQGIDGRVDSGMVQLYRQQQADKQWYLSKVNHRQYGDKVDHTVQSESRRITRVEHVIVPAPNIKPAKPADAIEISE